MIRWHVTRLIAMVGVILLALTVPAGNGSAANGPVNDTTRPVAPKKPVVLTIDGICFKAMRSIILNNACWTEYLKPAFSPDLADDYLMASFPWTRDPKETPDVVLAAERTIRGYSEVAKRRGQPFQVIAHSWGSVLAYIVLKNNPGIQVETLITLGSPLQSQDKIVVEKYTSRYAGTTIIKPANVRRWVNYWAWNDLISGPIDAADKNFQLDGQQSRTGYDTRLAAMLDFHEQYYTAWKASIIADLSSPATADDDAVYVDKGACPGECCRYGEWFATATTPLIASPSDPTVVADIRRGEYVMALTGEVHTIPSRFIVKKPRPPYKVGDIIIVYTYLGEGIFRVRHRGRIFEENLGFSPWSSFDNNRCQDGTDCFGELTTEYRAIWWIQIRTQGGVTGWTDKPDRFNSERGC